LRLSTRLIHGHGHEDPLGAVVPPIYVSSIHRFVDEGECSRSDRGVPYKYLREENPTVRAFERVLGSIEGGECVAFCSGMAAISAVVMAFARRGGRVVALMEMYSTTIKLLEELSKLVGFELVKAWPSTESVVEALSRGADLVLVECMTNPTLKVLDVEEIAKAARDSGTTLVVDNTFTTPLLLRPLKLGAQVSIHSVTKYIAGHNDVLGGAAIASSDLWERVWEWRRMLGTTMHPLEAYLAMRGAKTLEIRFEKQCRSAQAVAEFLAEHPRIEEVHYPGLPSDPHHSLAKRLFERPLFGAVVSFKVRGGLEEAKKVLRKVRIVSPAPSLGGTESLISIPALSAARYIDPETRRRLGITENLLRLSVGLEDVNDIIEDLDQALQS